MVLYLVAPLAGAWIEILVLADVALLDAVAPLAGAWIEITHMLILVLMYLSRSPRGSVD